MEKKEEWKGRRVERKKSGVERKRGKRFHFLLPLNESNIITKKQDKEKKRIFWAEMMIQERERERVSERE